MTTTNKYFKIKNGLQFDDGSFVTNAAGLVGATGATGPQGSQGQTGATGLGGSTGATGVSGKGFDLTSNTSMSIATGGKTFTVSKDASDSAWVVGSFVLITSVSSGAIMNAQIFSYSGTAMTVSVYQILGDTDTHDDWIFAPPAGLTGATGAQGATGAAGTNGSTGASGPSGSNGTNGSTGATGPQGAAGTNGSTGATGPAGSNGTNGSTGATGPAGTLSAPETQYNWGNMAAGTYSPNINSGTVHRATLTGNVTISSITNAVTGSNISLILIQDGTGSRTLTSTMKFAGGVKTLSTSANSIDVITIYFDGTNYLAGLNRGFI
jgi:hypothetical protein